MILESQLKQGIVICIHSLQKPDCCKLKLIKYIYVYILPNMVLSVLINNIPLKKVFTLKNKYMRKEYISIPMGIHTFQFRRGLIEIE